MYEKKNEKSFYSFFGDRLPVLGAYRCRRKSRFLCFIFIIYQQTLVVNNSPQWLVLEKLFNEIYIPIKPSLNVFFNCCNASEKLWTCCIRSCTISVFSLKLPSSPPSSSASSISNEKK